MLFSFLKDEYLIITIVAFIYGAHKCFLFGEIILEVMNILLLYAV